MNTSDNLGPVVKTARLRLGMTRKELAVKLKITPGYLASIETSKKKPAYYLLFHFIRELDISSEMILCPEIINDREKFEQAIVLLRKCDDDKLDTVIALLTSMLKINPVKDRLSNV